MYYNTYDTLSVFYVKLKSYPQNKNETRFARSIASNIVNML